ncbi:hypothetical protein Tco_0758340 [Tanacetum coccineum]
MNEITVLAKPVTTTEEAVPEHNILETYKNNTPKKHAYFDAKAETIHMILSGIGDDIYSTVDTCTTTKYSDTHYQALKPHKTYTPSSKPTQSNKSYAPTRNKGKEIAKPVTSPFESASEEDEDSDLEQAQRDKDMHFSKECNKPKWVKDYAYHKEKMMLCKQEEKGVSLSAEQGPTFDDEPLEQVQSNDDYNVFAIGRKHSKQLETINDTYVVETVDSNVIPNSLDMCDNEEQVDQNAEAYEDESVVLANLIANLKLDHDENKKTLKQKRKQTHHSLINRMNENMLLRSQMAFEIDAEVNFMTKRLSLRSTKSTEIVNLKKKR